VKQLDNCLKLSEYSDILAILVMISIDLFVFLHIEKVLKEFWVIRETSQKSFKTFYSIFDNNHRGKFIVDDSMTLLYLNKNFEETMKRLIGRSFPTQLKEFIHENSYDTFKENIIESRKQWKFQCTTVFLLKKKEKPFEVSDSSIIHTGRKLEFYNFQNLFSK
jgi:shikimate kinase